MKLKIFLLSIITSIFLTSNLYAQDSTQAQIKDADKDNEFVDKDNDGYNDNAPDHDGDGIPNGLDPDWQKLQKEKKKAKKKKFVDLDGDGINDNLQNSGKGKAEQIQQRKMDGRDGSSLENRKQKGQGQKQKGKKN